MKQFFMIVVIIALSFDCLIAKAYGDLNDPWEIDRGREDLKRGSEFGPGDTHGDHPKGPPGPFIRPRDCKNENMTVYILIAVIVILCIILLGLLLLVYKLKSTTKSNYDDKVEITKTESSSKYVRQLSSETTEIAFTRENSKDDNRFKLKREESKMSILDYPINQDENKTKREEPQTNANTLNKIKHHQANHMHKEQIDAICKAILNSQKKKEFSSLSSLDKIANEGKIKEQDEYAKIDKNASTSILDVVDNSSPFTVKKVISNFEAMPSPIPPKKFGKIADNKPQTLNKADETSILEGASSLPLRLPIVHTAKVMSSTNESETCDILPKENHLADLIKNDDEHGDDIYVDTPNNRPVSSIKNGDNLDEIYDNPPNNKPVLNLSDFCSDDTYDNPTNNKHVFEGAISSEEIYDSVKSENVDKDKGSLLEKGNDENIGNDYDFPASSSRILTKTDDPSGYSLTLTSDKDPCFDSSYVNARSFHC